MEDSKFFKALLFALSYLSLNSFNIRAMENIRIKENILELSIMLNNKIVPIEASRTLIINDLPLINIKLETNKISLLDENIGLTPLMEQILNNQTDNVDKIIEDGADVNQTIYEGISPLLLAIFVRNQRIIISLLNAEANLNDELITYAKKFANKDIIEILENFQESKRKTVKKTLDNTSLYIPDLQEICLDYLNLPKKSVKKKS